MSDDKTNRGPQDRSRINVNEDYELRYWTGELGCSKAELREAVKEAGPGVDQVRARLAKRS